MAVILSALVTARMPHGGGVAAMLDLDPAARAAAHEDLAAAVGSAYVLPAVLLTLSFVIAARALRPEPARAPAARV